MIVDRCVEGNVIRDRIQAFYGLVRWVGWRTEEGYWGTAIIERIQAFYGLLP